MAEATVPQSMNKVLLASIVQHLGAVAAQGSDATSEALQMAMDAVVANTELGTADFAAACCAPTLEDAFTTASAGKASVSGSFLTGLATKYLAAHLPCTDNPLFTKYVENLGTRGYFADLQPSSIGTRFARWGVHLSH
jgi:hypothetical protein